MVFGVLSVLGEIIEKSRIITAPLLFRGEQKLKVN